MKSILIKMYLPFKKKSTFYHSACPNNKYEEEVLLKMLGSLLTSGVLI